MPTIHLKVQILKSSAMLDFFKNIAILIIADGTFTLFDLLIPDNILNMDDYFITFDMLKDVNKDRLDFYIETPGGSGETAEEIVRFLRDKFTDVNFVVSGESKSAGTLMVLSGDEISMTKSRSPGPIDADKNWKEH